jgi:hypothetical protein
LILHYYLIELGDIEFISFHIFAFKIGMMFSM